MAQSYLKSDGLNLAWKTTLDANDSSAQEDIGAIRVLQDGRKFRYVQMTGSAMAEGKIAVPAAVTVITNLTCDTAKKVITDSGASWTPNAYVGYYFKVTTGGTGSEEPRKIVANTVDTLTLEKALGTALAAGGTDDGEIIPPKGVVVLSTASDASQVVSGVGIGTITQNYFGWLQIQGFASVIGTLALTESQPCTPAGGTTGEAADASAATDTVIGVTLAAGGAGACQLVDLKINE